MRSLDFRSYALSCCIAATVLAGCGGSQPPMGAPGAMPQTSAIATHAEGGKSWMLPEAKNQDLIYAVGGCGGTCILSYPGGKVVGAISGYSGWDYSADCSDASGNVYIADNDEVAEFAHAGTTPIAIFSLPGDGARGCSVDPVTGNLAVVYENSPVAVFKPGSGEPVTYESGLDATYCGYDNAGNLFVDGFLSGEKYGLAELPKGGSTFLALSVSQSVGEPGQIQWDGKYITYESGGYPPVVVFQLEVYGSQATVVGTTTLQDIRHAPRQSWIYNDTIIAPYSNHGQHATHIGTWKYPEGGRPSKKVTRFYGYSKKNIGFYGATLSVAP
ncbi:MAG: hypothetical protein ABSF08_13325 [Candidatus Cybelea sp.]|jgi:hypothetical protein